MLATSSGTRGCVDRYCSSCCIAAGDSAAAGAASCCGESAAADDEAADADAVIGWPGKNTMASAAAAAKPIAAVSAAGVRTSVRTSRDARPGRLVMGYLVAAPEITNSAMIAA